MHALLPGLVALLLIAPAVAGAQPLSPVSHDEIGRAFDDLAGQLRGLGDRLRDHFAPGDAPRERPLISIMLDHREALGLSAAQVQALEKIRTDFQRQAIKLEADQRVAQIDLAGLLEAEPVDLARVEAKVREVERIRGDVRLGRIRAIEQGKAQLTADQRARLRALLPDPTGSRPRAGAPVVAPGPERL
jgi:Spy/CpxP family protein refolding chaperone